MSSEMKNSYKFTNRDDWLDYAMANMRKIEAQQHNNAVAEIWLHSKRGVLGKWCDEINLGYIEEYRDEARLDKERMSYVKEIVL